MAKLLRDAKFFEAVKWNPHLKVVLDHRTDQVIQPATNEERRKRGLRPWSPQLLTEEMQTPSIP